MGYFQTDDTGTYVNEYAWNKIANMLYLESPAGSGVPMLSGHGSSECRKKGVAVGCEWDDGSQAEAYAHTLAAFHKAFPAFASHDLYLTGESYFGQCTRGVQRPNRGKHRRARPLGRLVGWLLVL